VLWRVLHQVHHEGGSKRVIVTKNLPGERWLDILKAADCRCGCVFGGGDRGVGVGGELWVGVQ
jgi:hypothetical protein